MDLFQVILEETTIRPRWGRIAMYIVAGIAASIVGYFWKRSKQKSDDEWQEKASQASRQRKANAGIQVKLPENPNARSEAPKNVRLPSGDHRRSDVKEE